MNQATDALACPPFSCRSIAERALRRVVANKDAEAVRLQSEVSRLRHRLSAAEAAADAAAGTPAAVPDAAGRQALLDAAVAAKEKPIATVLQLERYVEGGGKLP